MEFRKLPKEEQDKLLEEKIGLMQKLVPKDLIKVFDDAAEPHKTLQDKYLAIHKAAEPIIEGYAGYIDQERRFVVNEHGFGRLQGMGIDLDIMRDACSINPEEIDETEPYKMKEI